MTFNNYSDKEFWAEPTNYLCSEVFDNTNWTRESLKIVKITDDMMQGHRFKIVPCKAKVSQALN